MEMCAQGARSSVSCCSVFLLNVWLGLHIAATLAMRTYQTACRLPTQCHQLATHLRASMQLLHCLQKVAPERASVKTGRQHAHVAPPHLTASTGMPASTKVARSCCLSSPSCATDTLYSSLIESWHALLCMNMVSSPSASCAKSSAAQLCHKPFRDCVLLLSNSAAGCAHFEVCCKEGAKVEP